MPTPVSVMGNRAQCTSDSHCLHGEELWRELNVVILNSTLLVSILLGLVCENFLAAPVEEAVELFMLWACVEAIEGCKEGAVERSTTSETPLPDL